MIDVKTFQTNLITVEREGNEWNYELFLGSMVYNKSVGGYAE